MYMNMSELHLKYDRSECNDESGNYKNKIRIEKSKKYFNKMTRFVY